MTGIQGDKATGRQGDKVTGRQGDKARVSQTDAASPEGLRILVIEDEDNVRRFLEVTLTRLGHRPVLAADAQQGFSAFARERFDAVVTDLGLPGIDGKEVARTIAREAPARPSFC